MNYKEAKSRLDDRIGTRGNPCYMKIANNTILERDDIHAREIRLTLHGYTVLRFTPSYVELDTCGWPTPTTKDRLNYGPVSVSSDRHGWTLYLRSDDVECYCRSYDNPGKNWAGDAPCPVCSGMLSHAGIDWSRAFVFYDGIRVSNDGKRVLRNQPRKTDDATPLKTQSGWTGECLGFAAQRRRVA